MGLLGELMKSMFRPQEIRAMFQVKYSGYVRQVHSEPLDVLATKLNDVDFCYAALNKVSRSFAVVIQQLPEQLRDPVCVFYLVLRGLDSVEDDMDHPLNLKVPLLNEFHNKLVEDGWNIRDVGDSPDYRILLAHFEKVIRVFKGLPEEYQAPIKDITMRMGKGMADFAEMEVVKTKKEYDLYCHYVAGLVGYGLSDLFAASKLEDASLSQEHELSNSMGLFLQKTNIIRDYLEDLDSGRTWWPEDVWRNHGSDLSSFRDDPMSERSLACLNALVTDSLELVPSVLKYLRRLKNPQIFRFCAIPQVMAIATLSAVFNNPDVFRSVVKIRKGLSCRMMLETNDLQTVNHYFHTFAEDIAKRVNYEDPSADRTLELVDQVRELTSVELPKTLLKLASALAWIVLIVVSVYLVFRYRQRHFAGVGAHMAVNLESMDLTAMIAGFCSIAYMFGFFGMAYV